MRIIGLIACLMALVSCNNEFPEKELSESLLQFGRSSYFLGCMGTDFSQGIIGPSRVTKTKEVQKCANVAYQYEAYLYKESNK